MKKKHTELTQNLKPKLKQALSNRTKRRKYEIMNMKNQLYMYALYRNE